MDLPLKIQVRVWHIVGGRFEMLPLKKLASRFAWSTGDSPKRAKKSSSGESSARHMAGLYAQLSAEQRQAALAYDGPVASGDSDLPRIQR